MADRWFILAVLFIARVSNGFQFQSVAAVSSMIVEDFQIDYAGLGLLIGVFMLPGIVFAYPGGVLGKRFGEKRVVTAALLLMAGGGFLVGISDSLPTAMAGRIVSGIGSVFLNVLLTKMVADWFMGKEIVTAMGILVSSWPLGISLALIVMGPVAVLYSWPAVMHLTSMFCLLGALLIVCFYRHPGDFAENPIPHSPQSKLSRREIVLVSVAGSVWMFFNAGFITIPSFAPSFLTSAGYSVPQAGFLISTATWIVIPAIPLGGYLAEKFKMPNTFFVVCHLLVGICMCLMPLGWSPLMLLICIGLFFGPPAGIIMALPAEVLKPENRSTGMGLHSACFYTGMAVLQPLAGLTRDLTESPSAPLLFGAAMVILNILVFYAFRMLHRHNGAERAR